MSWCSTSRGGPTPARVTRTATPAIGMVSETQLPAIVLTLLWLLPSCGLVTANDVGPNTRLPRGPARGEAVSEGRAPWGRGPPGLAGRPDLPRGLGRAGG